MKNVSIYHIKRYQSFDKELSLKALILMKDRVNGYLLSPGDTFFKQELCEEDLSSTVLALSRSSFLFLTIPFLYKRFETIFQVFSLKTSFIDFDGIFSFYTDFLKVIDSYIHELEEELIV